MKKTQYAEAYVSFWQSNGVWTVTVSNAQYTGGNKQFRIAIPVPDELTAEDLPQMEKIEVNDD